MYHVPVMTEAPPTTPLREPVEVERLRIVLLRLARRIRSTTVGEVGSSQFSALITVLRHGPLGVRAIADHEHIRPPTASKMVSALEADGLVERRTHPDDRRCQQIAITQVGIDLVADRRAAGRGWLTERLDQLDDTDITQLAEVLPALERLLGVPDDPNDYRPDAASIVTGTTS